MCGIEAARPLPVPDTQHISEPQNIFESPLFQVPPPMRDKQINDTKAPIPYIIGMP